ncbi:MAG: hypothetical protein V1863_04105 [Candidatus Omnitrophota bacterium]
MVEPHVVIFLGTDEPAKQKKLEGLQHKLFPPDLKEFNHNVVYGDDKRLDAKALQEVLMCLPAGGAKRRLLVIRQAHQLGKSQRSTLLAELPKLKASMVVVLDIPEPEDAERLVEDLKKMGGQVHQFKTERPLNVFDLGRAIIQRQPQSALGQLKKLRGARQRTEKILGAVFWQWEHSYGQRRLSLPVYKKGLKLILEADKKLKSSSSAFARETLILETLVLRLAYLT